jgi:polysaccharide export outer membrane protein
MKFNLFCITLLAFLCAAPFFANAQNLTPAQPQESAPPKATPEYLVGIDDVLDISILRPEQILVTVTVAPDGSITFPYIGSVKVKDMALSKIQDEIQTRLAEGYMKYPVISVALKDSRSKKFFVYGEVQRPGTYSLEENITVLRAISSAGGFTKFGSSSRVKLLRLRKDKPGYEVIKVNINAVMNGSSEADVVIQSGDIITVSKGMF